MLSTEQRRELQAAGTAATRAVELSEGGRNAEAVKLAVSTLETFERIFGPDDLFTSASLNSLAKIYSSQKNYSAAEPLLQRCVKIEEKILGMNHPLMAESLNNLALAYQAQGKFTEAEPLFLSCFRITEKTLSPDHVDAVGNFKDLVMFYRARGKCAVVEPLLERSLTNCEHALGPNHPQTATRLHGLALVYEAQGKYAAAETLLERSLKIWDKALGSEHLDTAMCLNDLAGIYVRGAKFAAAEPLFERSLKIRENVLGPDDPQVAYSLNNLALRYQDRNDYASAERLFQRCLTIMEKAFGPDHPETATCLNNLAGLHKVQGDFAKAEAFLKRSLKIREAKLGLNLPDTAASLRDLAQLFRSQGKYAEAEPLSQRSLKSTEETLGPDHPDTAKSLNVLAALYLAQADYAAAEPLFRRSLEITERIFGSEHVETAIGLNNFAAVYQALREYTSAEPLLQRSLAIMEKNHGPDHPDTLMALANLAVLYAEQGNYSAAEPLWQRCLKIRNKTLGPEHPHTVTTLGNLAVLYAATGNDTSAEQLYQPILKIVETAREPDQQLSTYIENLARFCWKQRRDTLAQTQIRRVMAEEITQLTRTASIQTEQQQFSMTDAAQGTISCYVTFLSSDPASADETWQTLLEWKGLITARQTRLRQVLKDEPLYTEFRSLSQQLSTHALHPPLPPSDPQKLVYWKEQAPALSQKWQNRKATLEAEHERVEKELARKSADFHATIEQRRLTPQDLQKLLADQPEPTALVDLFEYTHWGRKGESSERRIVAFVVCGEGDVVRVELGAAKGIHELVKSWRETFGAGKAGQAAGQQLREKLWLSLAPHLAGIKIVVLSPDGALAQLPWGALPGEKLGSYLLEDVALAVIPVPQMLPELLKAAPNSSLPSSLLLAGDIDYGGDPGAVSSSDKRDAVGRLRDGKLFEFTRLPAGPAEMAGIEKRYQPKPESRAADMLRGSAATEAAFCEQARQHAWLHLITHGYFAPETVRSALAPDPDDEKTFRFQFDRDRPRIVKGEHPGLLSGLAFAGANTPPAPGHDDGILTALEVSALDLSNVDAVVLSACETGLGEVAGGEGLLGLQRAFQVAGAKTVVASLWKVPDAETSLLMLLFYENVWEKKLPRLEALRQAQLQLLHNYDAQSHTLRGTVGKLKPPTDPAPTDPANKTASRCPPFFWAAFVLSGDWR